MTIANICKACKGTFFGSEELLQEKIEITGVQIDSRKIEAGNLFIPMPGERVDGHQFIKMVMEAGALVTLSEKELDLDVPYIMVDSCPQALKDLASFYRDQLDCTIVGITGSVGKTSTKEMIAAVLGQKFKVQKTAGNFNNEIGLPLTIFSITKEHQVAVVEMGISDFGEMTRLAQIARPDLCVLTNIGYCHLDQLGDRSGVLKAKSECFPFVKEGGAIILNKDDDQLATVKNVPGRNLRWYSLQDEQVTAYGTNVESCGLDGMDALFMLTKENGQSASFPVHIPIPGDHNVMNALAASVVGQELGLDQNQIQAGIQAVQTIQGRTNLIHNKEMLIIDDCYNANPMSMKASIQVLSASNGRKVAILGDMGELGEDRRALHYQVGEAVAKGTVDTLIAIGELAIEMIHALKDQGVAMESYYFENKQEALPFISSYVQSGDTILVKASHFMQFEEIVELLSGK